jgi:mRNA interferase MazF
MRVNMTNNFVRGQVYWAYLDPVIGSEQMGRRPVVIVSPDSINNNLGRLIVLPVTRQMKDWPTFIPIEVQGSVSYAMLDQVRTIDQNRLKGHICDLTTHELTTILSTLCELFEL